MQISARYFVWLAAVLFAGFAAPLAAQSYPSKVIKIIMPVAFINLPALLQFIKTGRLRAIAVADARRSDVLPEIPTLNEAGLPGLIASPWSAMMAPAATPKEIITRLNAEVVKIMRSPEMKQYLASQGANPLWSTPEETRAFIRDEIGKWAKVAREAGIGPE